MHTKSMRVWSACSILAALCSLLVSVSCQQDLGVEQRKFQCSDDDDCLEGFSCRPFEGSKKSCLPEGGSDAAGDAPVTVDVDAGGSAPDISDGDDTSRDVDTGCAQGKVRCGDQCVDLSTSNEYCGNCTTACPSSHLCVDGSCIDSTCPTAKIEASILNSESREVGTNLSLSANIMASLKLDGSPSATTNGSIAAYEWSVVAQGDDSSSSLADPTAETTELVLDTYGDYMVSLKVFDSDGTESCERATAYATVAPDADVAIQLTWERWSDSHQTDSNLDLHYLHPNGNWNRTPWDTFWNNKNPNWGSSGSSDDPRILAVNDDGTGSEHLVHNNLESTLTYKIGVHHYDDNGTGPSYATIRVYVDGGLAHEYLDKYIAEEHFWDFGRIDADTGEITIMDQTYSSGFPN